MAHSIEETRLHWWIGASLLLPIACFPIVTLLAPGRVAEAVFLTAYAVSFFVPILLIGFAKRTWSAKIGNALLFAVAWFTVQFALMAAVYWIGINFIGLRQIQ